MALKALLLKKELDGKRSAMNKLNREEEFEKRTAELEAAINEMTEENTPEERDAVSAEIDKLEEEKTENASAISQLREEIEKLEAELDAAEQENIVPDDKPEERTNKMDEMITRDSKEYVEAYAEYIKGNKKAADLRNMLTTTNDTTPNGTATVPVPSFVYDVVKTAWERDGIMALVRKAYLRGNLKVGFEISGSDASVHAEGASAISAEDLVLGVVELVPESIKKVVQVSDEALDLGGEEFLRYIYDELTYRIAKKAADELIAKIEACGTVSTTTCPSVPKVKAASIALGTIASAIAQLSGEAANPVVMMNKATWGAFKSAQYAASYPVDIFEGLPVVYNNSIKAFSAATTGETYAIVGDLGHGALANFPNGEEIEFKFDNLSLKKQDLVEVFGRKYVAIGVVAPNAFVKVTK
jgi:HK97 family phage major capsid protein